MPTPTIVNSKVVLLNPNKYSNRKSKNNNNRNNNGKTY